MPLYEVLEHAGTSRNSRPAVPDQTASADDAAEARPATVAAARGLAQWDAQQLAEYLYIRYTKHARHEGGTLYAPADVSFEALPEADKRTLVLLARDVQGLLTHVNHEGYAPGKQ
jgi:hypothetical protein